MPLSKGKLGLSGLSNRCAEDKRKLSDAIIKARLVRFLILISKQTSGQVEPQPPPGLVP